jgi:HSP20 family protein
MMTNILRPFDNMLDAMWNEVNNWTGLTDIPTNVKEDEQGYTIELAVPGLERKNFHMMVRNGVLNLRIRKGHRFCWPWQHNHTYIRGERQLRLPESVDQRAITAKINDGILSIRLPKKDSYVSRSDGQKSGSQSRQ